MQNIFRIWSNNKNTNSFQIYGVNPNFLNIKFVIQPDTDKIILEL